MDAAFSRHCRQAARAAAIIVGGIGACGFAGWVLDNEILKGVFRSGITMKANAAIGLGLAAVALWTAQEGTPAWARRLGHACAGLVALLGGLTLLQHVSGADFGIDQLLFEEPPGQSATASPGRMGPPGALSLLLAGLALLPLTRSAPPRPGWFQSLALTIGAVAIVPLMGYAHGIDQLYSISRYTGVALHTAVALFVLGTGILLVRPTLGLMTVFASADAGGLMARRLIGPVLLLPFLVGWARWLADTSGVIASDVSRPLSVLLLTFAGIAVIVFNARRLSFLDRHRTRTLRDGLFLNQLHQELNSLHRAEPMMRTALAQLSRHLEVSRCCFLEWRQDQDEVRVAAQWQTASEMPLQARYRLEDYLPAGWRSDWARGGAVPDVEREDALGAQLGHYRALGVRAVAVCSFVATDGSAFSLLVADRRPRAWKAEDRALLQAVTERVWPLVERARVEQALRASEARLRTVTENAPILLASIDRELRYVFVNAAYARRFQRSVDQVVGATVREIVGEPLYQKIGPRLEAVLQGERFEGEIEAPDPELGLRHLHVIYIPDMPAEGEVAGIVAVITDITERKKAAQELERTRDQAVAASQAKDAFIAMLSHELRTPLSPVLLLASEGAADPALPAEVRQDFDTIRHHVEQEARLIDDLLDLSRISRGKLTLDLAEISGTAVVREAVTLVQAEAEAKGVAMTAELPEVPALLRGDLVRLQQVLWNILKNAVKFTPAGGRIRVRAAVSAGGDELVVTVGDTGLGMTPTELERAFDAFAQGDHAQNPHKGAFGGLGLGLAISRLLVTMHGGTITAASEGRNRGATVRVALPLLAATAGRVQEDRVDPAGVGPRPVVNWRPQARVLVVEDHPATRETLVMLLERRGCRVIEARTKAEALARAARHPFDLVISDLGLPDGDGCELMAELRRVKPMPGIALTGFGMEEDMARTRAAGFVAHLTKPISIAALESAMAAALEPGSGPTPPPPASLPGVA